MAFINTSRKVGVSINGRNYSDNLISGTISDDSSLSTSIIKASGSIVLGGAHGGSHVDLFGNKFPVGAPVSITCSVPGSSGLGATHPRGKLYVISSSSDIQQQTTNVEVGCKLQLLSSYPQALAQEIFGLYGLVEEYLKYFVIQDYSLSTLDSILQSLGKAIFQSSGGGIQLIDVPVGIGTTAGGGGFTSIDQETAIEMSTFADVSSSDDPLSLSITLSYDIPTNPKEEEPEQPPEPEVPPPDPDPDPDPGDPGDGEDTVNEVISETNYIKTKKLKLKPFNQCLKVYKGKKTVIEYDDAKALRSCAAYLNPKYILSQEEIDDYIENGDPCAEPLKADDFIKIEDPYSYQVEGSLDLEEEVYFSDYVESFAVTSYRGPGNQADADWTWESQSVWLFGEQIISQWFDFMKQEFENAASEANSWCEQANEYFELRDENNIYAKTELEIDCLTLEELNKMRRDYLYNDCAGVNALLNADELILYCGSIYNEIIVRFNSLDGRRSLNNFNIRRTTFGKGGEVVKRVSKQIVHRAASHLAKDYIDKYSKVFDEQEPDFYATVIDRTRDLPSYGRYRFDPLFTDVNIRLYTEIEDPPVVKTVSSSAQGGSKVININENDDYDAEPDDNGNVKGSIALVMTSQTIEEYTYLTSNGTPLIKETVTNIDYANKNNGSKQVKISTDYSTAAASERSNANASEAEGVEGDETTGDEENNGVDSQDDNPCQIETEQREVIYRVSRGGPTVRGPGSSLQNSLALYDQAISMPAQFRPLVPQRLDIGQVLTSEDCNALAEAQRVEASERLAIYEELAMKYLAFEMAKRLGDNRGFRVTESMRPELYNYHPYMNVSLVSRTNGFSCSGMVGSANWAFDQQNALCSFDCYVFGYNDGVPFGSATYVSIQQPVEIPPGQYEVITTDMLELSDNAYTVKLQKIENQYYKYYLDDVELPNEPTVFVVDIANGRLRLYNFTPEEPPPPEEE